MIRIYISCVLLFFVFSCSNIEFVLKDKTQTNPLKNNTLLLVDKNNEERLTRSLYSFFGNNKEGEYILKTKLLERKTNRIVKNNQVAEKIDYTIEVNYNLFDKTNECEFFSDKVVTNFSFTPKSSGYNFGSDRSFDKLYNNSIDQNINDFIDALQINKGCLE